MLSFPTLWRTTCGETCGETELTVEQLSPGVRWSVSLGSEVRGQTNVQLFGVIGHAAVARLGTGWTH